MWLRLRFGDGFAGVFEFFHNSRLIRQIKQEKNTKILET